MGDGVGADVAEARAAGLWNEVERAGRATGLWTEIERAGRDVGLGHVGADAVAHFSPLVN